MPGSTRLLPAEVLAAFRALDLQPAQHIYVGRDAKDKPCACGLAAIALQREVCTWALLRSGGRSVAQRLMNGLGLHLAYAIGWIDGWDDLNETNHPYATLPEFQEGQADGRAAWRDVTAAYGWRTA